MKRERLFDLKACPHCGATTEALAPFMFPTLADDGGVLDWVVACGDIWACGAAVASPVADDAAARWNRRHGANEVWPRTMAPEMAPDLVARTRDEDDGEGPFEDIGDGVSVRAVSDAYAADVMGITPEALREMIEGLSAGDVKTFTLDEVIEGFKKDDPDFEAKLEQARAEARDLIRRRGRPS